MRLRSILLRMVLMQLMRMMRTMRTNLMLTQQMQTWRIQSWTEKSVAPIISTAKSAMRPRTQQQQKVRVPAQIVAHSTV
jgi:hypothetical protein